MPFSYQNYTGDNTTVQFSIPFTYQNTSEISVTVDGVAETGLTFPSSSVVQVTSAPATNTLVQVRRTTSLTSRAIDFASGSVLTEEDLDDSNIQVFHAAQEAIDIAGDSITLTPANRWDAGGSVINNVGTPTVNTDAATKAYADGITATATAAAVSAANTAVAVATADLVPDATKLAIHPINTQYTLSDGTTIDFSAKHYANVASTQATAAAADVVLTNADVVTAAAAVTAAENARDATLAAYDNFDDRYLGVFITSNEPTLDNDGDALVAGALYFNSTDGAMKVYTGSAWVAAYVSGTGFLALSGGTMTGNIALSTANITGTGNVNITGSVTATSFAGDGSSLTNLPAAGIANVVDDTTPQLGGPLDVNGNSIISVSNADINIQPNGTGNVTLGNFTFDADQSVGAGQDNYVMTYNQSTLSLSLEPASGGGGSFLGEAGGGLGDIIRVHEQQLDTNVTVATNTNGLAAGPLIIATGVTVTVNGNLVIA